MVLLGTCIDTVNHDNVQEAINTLVHLAVSTNGHWKMLLG